MSRSTLTAIAGATIGFFVGGVRGAQIGWTIGSFIGAEGPGDSQGPRLNDLQAENIDYGADIPIVYGRARIAGFRMWQRDIREQANEEDSGGKGGGGSTVTTFTYYGTFAIALCEGPIAGVRKIWADSNLIYNVGDTASLETLQASNRAASGIRIYLGTSTQDPDSLIQATQGAANTPAYRNTAYIVFDDLALEKYGNRIPNITAEVVGAGAEALRLITTHTLPDSDGGVGFNVSVPYWNHEGGFYYVFMGDWDSNYFSNGVKVYKRFSNGTREEVSAFTVSGSSSSYNPSYTFSRDGVYQVYGAGSIFTRERFRVFSLDGGAIKQYRFISNGGVTVGDGHFCIEGDYIFSLYVSSSDGVTLQRSRLSLSQGYTGSDYGPTMEVINDESGDMKNDSTAHHIDVADGLIYVLNNDDTIQVFDIDGALQDTISFSPSPSITYSTTGFGEPNIRVVDGLIYIASDVGIFSMQMDGTNITYYGNPSSITAQNPYGYGGRDVKDKIFYQYEPEGSPVDGGRFRAFALDSLSIGSVTLSSIVSDICTRAGIWRD